MPQKKRPIRCHFGVVGYCKTCLEHGQKVKKDGATDKCHAGHSWRENMVMYRGNDIIRGLPENRELVKSEQLCEHTIKDGRCIYVCPHATSQMESEIWKWMVENKVTTPEALIAACTRPPERAGSLSPAEGQGRLSKTFYSTDNLNTLEDNSADVWKTVQRKRHTNHRPVIKNKNRFDALSQNPGSAQPLMKKTPQITNYQIIKRRMLANLPGFTRRGFTPGHDHNAIQGTNHWQPFPNGAPNSKSANVVSGTTRPKDTSSSKSTKVRLERTCTQSQLPNRTRRSSVQSHPDDTPMAENTFPLGSTHSWKIACFKCLQETSKHSYYNYIPSEHSCDEDTLAVRENNSSLWQYVRVRLGQNRLFHGHYQLCRNFTKGRPCCLSERLCSFAHHLCEQQLWNMEKNGQFNINEFIKTNRSPEKQAGYSLELLKQHGGAMIFLCKKCFFCPPARVSYQADDVCQQGHSWAENKMMMHIKDGAITPIKYRPFKHKNAYFNLCYNLNFCQKDICKNAHSSVERAVWIVENDMQLTRDQICEEMQNESDRTDDEVQLVTHVPFDDSRPTRPAFGAAKKQSRKKQSSVQAAETPLQEHAPQLVDCPYRVWYVCNTCRKSGQKVPKGRNPQFCAGRNRHNWKVNRVAVTGQHIETIRELPGQLPRKFAVCIYGRSCFRYPKCPFAHSEIEREIWTWQVAKRVRTLDALVEISEKAYSTQANRQQPKQSVAGPLPSAHNQHAPLSNINPYYCKYCATTCNGQRQWDDHCTSPEHVANVNSDKDHQWNYRQPPWNVHGNYRLCRCTHGEFCTYRNSEDMHNACTYAHSQDELDEWNERLKWRRMKSEMAKTEGAFSYMDNLLEEYEQAEKGLSVLAESIGDVSVNHAPLAKYTDSKTETFTWTFQVVAKNGKALNRVALLNNKDRLHFELAAENVRCQIRRGEDLEVESHKEGCRKYEIKVHFRSDMFGSFHQKVVFDFGSQPVLYKDIIVDVGNKGSHDKVQDLREQLKFDRWTNDNREIVRIEEPANPFHEQLLRKYKVKDVQDIITQTAISTELKSTNYVHKMHELLYLEEMTQQKIVSSFNVCTTVDLLEMIREETTIVRAYPGELFAHIKLDDELTNDTDAGGLILASVRTVLISTDDSSKKVYEVKFVEKEVYDFDGRGRDHIYLRLHQACCTSLKLSPETKITLAIQFQMDRKPFARMHYALDQLQNTDLLFPDLAKISKGLQEKEILELSSSKLNATQMKIVSHIVKERHGYTPPMIVYGPFGTGKTETLAQATRTLVENVPLARILICTMSNSAADVYLEKYLGDLPSSIGIGMKRVVTTEKKPSNTSQKVLEHCFLSEDRTRFVKPERSDLEGQKIIITTFTNSLSLFRLGLRGSFTHIFIDEAGQALECEAMMPMLLAGTNTCVVLAGDHIQIRPKVYSKEAERQGFHESLLERLFYFYQRYTHLTPVLTTPLHTLLHINYRSNHEIVQYLAKAFYNEKLVCESMLPSCDNVQSMMFMTVKGEEVQDQDGRSYYNVSEASEVSDAVKQLLDCWPQEWGERRPRTIAVVTPYQDQVKLIRDNLRKKRLKDVTVERVHNVQGREFRAIFISTVRTFHICDALPDESSNASDYGFLTDKKLLNTAMTRAQSLVAVVGDPIALCAIGVCLSVWRTFIEHCDHLGSIHPANVNLGVIKTAVTQFISHPITGRRTEIINEQLKKKREPAMTHRPTHGSMARTEDAGVRDNTVETDEILKQLALEVVRNQRQVSQQGAHSRQLGVEEIRVECIRVKETHNSAILTYSPKKPKRRLLGEADAGRDYDSDEDGLDDVQLPNYANLRALLLKDKKKYRECIFHFDRRSMYADIIDRKDTDGRGRIVMSSRLRCGQAFDNDTVVVEILEAPKEDVLVNPAQKRELLGQVVGVLKRAIDPKYKIFVCTVDPNNTGIMAPINRGIPRISNLSTEVNCHRKGHVTVHKFTNDHDIVFDHYEAIDEFKPKSKLFMVRYLKWDPGFFSPLGIVVDILEEGTTIEKGLKIVNAEHQVHHSYNNNALSEVDQKYPDGYQYPADIIKRRTDLRDLMVFAIDPEGCQDVDDCLSLEAQDEADSDTKIFVVGIHIADVSHFIERGSALDEEAKKRGTSLYPPGSAPVHMLPEALSTDILSLHESKEKLTLSMFITVDGNGNVLKVEPKRCIVKSKCQLSYQEAEMILHQDSTSYSKELKQRVWGLYHIAQQWRRQRQGTAALYLPLDEEDEDSPYAHLLVSEMMLMANQKVASYLFEKYPNCTPLRRQLSPNELELDEWREKHAVAALNSLVLRRPFIPSGWTCECVEQCDCVSKSMESSSLDGKFFDIKTEVWQKLMQFMNEGDVEAVRNLILKPENHPQLWLAQSQYRKILNMADYVCSDKDHEDINWHYSENLPKYTHFTSPIRRYLDIVVHRLLVAAMQGSPCPYGQEEITEICNLMTAAARRGNSYERTLLGLHMGSALQTQPVLAHPVVDEVDDHSVHFSFLNKKKLHGIQSLVKLSELGIAGRPDFDDAESRVLARWQQRIYNLGKEIEPRDPKKSKPGQVDELVRLNPNRFVLQVPAKNWQKILQAVQADNLGELAKNVGETKVRDLTKDTRFVKEVTSEMKNEDKIMQHHCHFEQTIEPGHVKQVQLAKGMSNGLMVPRIQLINLSPNFNICIEHLVETQNCFARLAVRKASCKDYKSIEAYQKAWLSVLAMESATGAIRNDENYQIRNVSIQWTAHSARPKAGEEAESEDSDDDNTSQDDSAGENTFGNKKLFKGVFDLSVQFCQARHIKLSTAGEPEVAATDVSFDYMCIRYPGIAPDTDRDQNCVVKAFSAQTVTWVGHCLMTKVKRIKAKKVPGQKKGDDLFRVTLKLHQSSMPFPSQLLHDHAKPCTVEFIPKALPNRRMEAAIRTLTESANSLARQIALKKNQGEFAYASSNAVADACKVTDIPGLPSPNTGQRNAIRAALTKKFTLIQGPPGTGKTATGAVIAYLFSLVNRKLGDMSGAEKKATKAQVLYCGPSNKSVDVVAGYLKRLKGQCPGIVRVYSELIEHKDFPLPGEPIPPKRRADAYENSVTKDHRDIALHFMIRQNNTDSAKEILAHDKRFRERPTEVTEEEVEKYQKLVTSCEIEVLKNAAIILCTCTASASNKIKATRDIKDGLEPPCNVNQVIIDECGMCQEPESMVPIVAARPTQVVLIGDHKQLRPIILNDTAKILGLDKSLFERHSEESIMLTVQYRMHTAISEFPSNHFYEGKLSPALPFQYEPSKLMHMWPGATGANEPIAFWHIMGPEEVLTVSSAEGNEQSRKNQAEADQAVKFAALLKDKHGVFQKQIVILSQYRAQCAEIEKLLKHRQLTAITVSTVVASQGSEWDYVILSTVRSLPRSEIEKKPTTGWMRRKLGFITDQNQINVALTRARRGLIIIGNKHLLRCDKMWNELLKEYEKKGKIIETIPSKRQAWQKR
ncbi:3'-5' exoribonuclease HELZ2-like [Lineus longissimus]|uniref:3'-5' exoribonuclease HELZ2-like n=1 Tax=Lineus longissimus TaxID=88925 RepID=UPI00315DB2D5